MLITNRSKTRLAEVLGWANVHDFGAKGNGSTDDTVAVQKALDSFGPEGGPIFLPPDSVYRITSSLVGKLRTSIIGSGGNSWGPFGPGFYDNLVCGFDARDLAGTGNGLHILRGANNVVGNQFRDFFVRGNANVLGGHAEASEFGGTVGLHLGNHASHFEVSNLWIVDCTHGIIAENTQSGLIENCYVKRCHYHGLVCRGATHLRSRGNNWSDSYAPSVWTANLYVTDDSQHCEFSDLVDEALASDRSKSVWFGWCSDCALRSNRVYTPHGGIGVQVGDGVNPTLRVRLEDLLITPYNGAAGNPPLNTVRILPTAEDTFLDIQTLTVAGGGDVADLGVRTVYRRVNSFSIDTPGTKAGEPRDTDYPFKPPTGTQVIDTAGNNLWTKRESGIWSSAPLTDGTVSALRQRLVAYWKMDEATGAVRMDEEGTRHLAQTGGVTQVAGKLGNAAGFGGNATQQYLRVENNAVLQVGSQDFSLGGWVWLTSKPSPLSGIVCKLATGGPYEFWIRHLFGSDRFVFGVVTGSGIGEVSADTFGSPPLDQWIHLACGFSHVEEVLWIQINGGARDTYPLPYPALATAAPLTLGVDLDGIGSRHLDGRLDGWGFWKSPIGAGGSLTPEQVAALYNAGAGLDHPF